MSMITTSMGDFEDSNPLHGAAFMESEFSERRNPGHPRAQKRTSRANPQAQDPRDHYLAKNTWE